MIGSIHVDVSLSNSKKFIEECNVAVKFDHPNVLNVIGVSISPEEDTPLMVMPFMHNGNVQSYLKFKRGDSINFRDFPKVHIIYSF